MCHTHTDLLKSCCTKEKKYLLYTHTNIPTIYPIYKEYIRYIKYCTLSFSVFISVHTYIICLYCYLFIILPFRHLSYYLNKKKENLLYQFIFSCTLLCWLLIVYCCFFKHVLVFIHIYYCYLLAPLYIHYTTHTHAYTSLPSLPLSLSLSQL